MLNLLDRYIIRKFLATFFVAITLIILIVIVFDVSEKLDDFLESNVPLNTIIFQYYFNFIPYFVNLFSHLFVFVSVIFFTSKLASRSEIVAILASGIHFHRFLRPYIIAAIFLAGFNLVLSNWVIPKVNIGRIDFEQKYIRRSRNFWQNIHIQSAPQTQVYASSFDNQQNVGSFFTYEQFSDSDIALKITANRIYYDTLTAQWTLYKYTMRKIDGLSETLTSGDSMCLDFNLKPEDFAQNAMNVQVMDYAALNACIKQERSRGSTYVTTYLVEKYQRLLNPLAIVILTIMGVSLSCRKTRRGIGAHLGLGVALAFGFIILIKISTVFSTKGNLPAIFSVLLPIVLFSIITFFLVKNTPK